MTKNRSNSTVTKTDLVESVSEKSVFTKREAAFLVDLVFATMKEILSSGKPLKIARFGQFDLLDKKARRGRNPRTGETVTIAARRALTFKASSILKEKVSNGERK